MACDELTAVNPHGTDFVFSDPNSGMRRSGSAKSVLRTNLQQKEYQKRLVDEPDPAIEKQTSFPV